MSLEFWAIIGIIFVILIILVVWSMPEPPRQKVYRPKAESASPGKGEDGKDWKAAALKMEKHIYELRNEVLALQKREKELDRELLLTKEKSKKLQEKMSQERDWQKKEEEDFEKKAKEIERLRADFARAESELESEHGQRLAAERQLQELKIHAASEADIKRGLESEAARLRAQAERDRKDLSELRAANAKLSKQEEEKTFISKAEYEKLEQKLKDREREIERFKAQFKREP